MSTDRFRADFTAMNLALRDRVLSLRRVRAPEEKE
jgi:hypothetical protein